MTSTEPDTISTPEPKTHQFSPSHSSNEFDWSKLQPLIRPASVGLLSAALLVAVVAGLAWGQNVSANSGNTSTLASAWFVVLNAVAILFGLLVSVGIPLWWARTKGHRKALAVIAFELVFLTLALLISGSILFSGNNSNSTGNNQVNPGGPNCSEGEFGC